MVLEEKIVRHCSPTLYGIKPANLIAVKREDCGKNLSLLNALNARVNERGIFFFPLRSSDDSVLILVYNRALLERHIFNFPEMAFLEAQGYPVAGGLNAVLLELFARCSSGQDFPHEIGIFLGYPLEDVEGFIVNKGRDYKFCGIWKVYGDEERARNLFFQFSECTKKCSECFSKGISIEQICAQSKE